MNPRYIAGFICLVIAIVFVLLLVNLFDRSGLEVRSHPPRDAVVAAGELARDAAVGEYLHADFVTDQFLEDLHLRRVEEERQERLRQQEARRKLELARANPSFTTATGTTIPVPSGDVFYRLAMCETGGTMNQRATSPSGRYLGFFQFSLETWAGVGGTGDPRDFDYATQLGFAKKLQARSGWGQWPHCSKVLGLR